MSDDSVFVHPQAVFDSIRAMQSTLTAVAPPPDVTQLAVTVERASAPKSDTTMRLTAL